MADITVTEHLLLHQKRSPQATGQFTGLLYDLILSGKSISRRIAKAGLLDILGGTGEVNVQGEDVQKMDSIANRILLYRMERCGALCAMGSEEEAELIRVSKEFPRGDYILIFDPLDGSSNIDVNVSVGTIFSVYRRVTPVGTPVSSKDFLQPGTQQVAAGYVIYGTSTMIVYTTGHGVNGFTLNPAIGTFYLSHPNMQFSKDGKIYSINEGNYVHFPQGVKDYLKYCQFEEDDRPYTSRYIGSLVSDIHRNMIKGGIYIYPTSSKAPNGKLRLLYECNPMAFIAEQAGGKASDGYRRILEIEPTELHQRVPFFCGSAAMVTKAEEFMAKALKP